MTRAGDATNCSQPAGVPVGAVPVGDEFACFDRLGPLAREAINHAPLKVLAFHIFRDIVGAGFDPRNPRVDAHVAESIKDANVAMLLKDRSERDAKVRPLVARRVKAARRSTWSK